MSSPFHHGMRGGKKRYPPGVFSVSSQDERRKESSSREILLIAQEVQEKGGNSAHDNSSQSIFGVKAQWGERRNQNPLMAAISNHAQGMIQGKRFANGSHLELCTRHDSREEKAPMVAISDHV